MFPTVISREPLLKGNARTVDLLIKNGCFIKNKNVVLLREAADQIYFVLGGQPYSSFPFSKDSLGMSIKG
jgi:hypothetical protein